MPVSAQPKASPLVGEVGGGPAASAAEKILLLASSAVADDAPPPDPPHKGEGLKRLLLKPDAIQRARRLRKQMTKPERHLWRALREALPQWHWRKQVPLGPYFADFASHSAKLIIELDGGQHAAATDRDAERTRFLESEGFRVIRFWNHDVLANTDGVMHRIAETLCQIKASPLVGECTRQPCPGDRAVDFPRTSVLAHGGGPAASAAEKTPLLASSAVANDAPPPNPPHEGEDSERSEAGACQ